MTIASEIYILNIFFHELSIFKMAATLIHGKTCHYIVCTTMTNKSKNKYPMVYIIIVFYQSNFALLKLSAFLDRNRKLLVWKENKIRRFDYFYGINKRGICSRMFMTDENVNIFKIESRDPWFYQTPLMGLRSDCLRSPKPIPRGYIINQSMKEQL